MNKRESRLSLWERDILLGECELVVVGAGLTGLQAAINYAQKRNTDGRVLMLDREPFIRRASTRNAGFAVFGNVSEILDDIDKMGFDRALELVEWRARSLQKLLETVPGEIMEYNRTGGLEIFLEEQMEYYDRSGEYMDPINERLQEIFGEKVYRDLSNWKHLPFKGIKACISNPYEGLLHPGKLVQWLESRARQLDIEICTGFEVTDFESTGEYVQLILDHSLVLQSERVLVATNGLAGSLLPGERVSPARNVVALTEPLAVELPSAAYHCERGYLYFRPVKGNRLLIGGGRHWMPSGDQTVSIETDEAQLERLMQFANRLMDSNDITTSMSWAGTLGIGPERMPILKQVNDGVVACVRLGGMGVALSASLGEQAAGLLLDL